MILKDDGDIETEDESDNESMPLLADESGVEYPVDGKLLVARRAVTPCFSRTLNNLGILGIYFFSS